MDPKNIVLITKCFTLILNFCFHFRKFQLFSMHLDMNISCYLAFSEGTVDTTYSRVLHLLLCSVVMIGWNQGGPWVDQYLLKLFSSKTFYSVRVLEVGTKCRENEHVVGTEYNHWCGRHSTRSFTNGYKICLVWNSLTRRN